MDHKSVLRERIIELSTAGRCTSLDLSGKVLTEIPDSIGQLTSLKILDLSRNKITEIPESIGKLVNLQTINLKSNQISMIPETISHLDNLKNLMLVVTTLKKFQIQ